jgi:hypothetical protein
MGQDYYDSPAIRSDVTVLVSFRSLVIVRKSEARAELAAGVRLRPMLR